MGAVPICDIVAQLWTREYTETTGPSAAQDNALSIPRLSRDERLVDRPTGSRLDAAWTRNHIEEWFLSRGMPTVARSSSSFRALLLRVTPLMTGYCALFLTITITDVLLRELRPADYRALMDPDAASPRWYLGTLVLAVALGIAAGVGVNRVIRRHPLTVRQVLLLTTAAPLAMLLLPFVDSALGLNGGAWYEMVGNLIIIGIALALTKIGTGAILAWSIRRALSQGLALTSLTARALPLILLVTLFSFFSEAMWTVTGTLPRGDLWKVILILLAIAAVFVWAVIRDELRGIAEGPPVDIDDIRERGFPADALDARNHGGEEQVTLSRRESANAMSLLLIAQGIQLGFLVVLVFAFFCVFGDIAVPPAVVESWTGKPPSVGVLMRIRLPVSNELIQTSLFLAAFSAVSFAASSVTDPAYRKSFFDPLLKEVAVTVTARHLYRASRDNASRASIPSIDTATPWS